MPADRYFQRHRLAVLLVSFLAPLLACALLALVRNAIEGLPTDSELRVLVRNADITHGEFLLTASTHVARPTIEQRKVACLLADQVGAALALEGR